MHAIVTSLTAAALVTHALIGCFGHLARHCPQCEPPVAAEPCCHHEHDAGLPTDEGSPVSPCRCVLTCHGGCVTLPPQKTEIDAAPAGAWSSVVAVERATADDLLASADRWQRGHAPDFYGPHVRPHLLHQSLLI